MPWWMSQAGNVENPSPMARWAAAATRKFRRVWQGEAGMLLTDSPAPVSLPLITIDAPETQLAPASLQPRRAAFTRQVFEFEGERYGFNLYVPPQAMSGEGSAPLLPLLVMLHGCQQDAPDFARGTGMNELAAQAPCLVLYPEQLAKANQMRCWNWYDIAHQGPHAGEPAMLVALTRKIISLYPVDATRVYIAGLSAGGAMAAIVAAHHPRLFAAVGVHSGLPPGAAHDVMSFAVSATAKGAFIRVLTTAKQQVDLYLHPATAFALRETLAGAGIKAGWLGEDGSITYPRLPDEPRTGH